MSLEIMSDEPTINTNFSITHFIKKKKKKYNS
jgi:hypothetical protein